MVVVAVLEVGEGAEVAICKKRVGFAWPRFAMVWAPRGGWHQCDKVRVGGWNRQADLTYGIT